MQLRETDNTSASSLHTLDDRQLLARIAERDETAFRVILERYGPHAQALTSAILPDAEAADDVMLSAFRDIWRSPAAYVADGRTVRSRVMQSVHEKSTERARQKRAGHPAQSLRSSPTAHVTPAPPRKDPRFDGSVIGTLPVEQRRVIELIYLGGLSIPEVAARLGITAASATSHMTGGMRALRAMMNDHF